ncbi:hypothetical protein EVC30_153 [Rhizobium phage RHph_Y1_11]|nr:hypothetical protein EVC30_153 [Rhizobium phage RHph_Y1_11]
MMKLIDPTVVLDHLGKDASPDNISAATSAVEIATATIEARLATAFKAGTKTDIFFVTSGMAVGSIFLTRFWLSRGFVSNIVAITATSASALSGSETTTLTEIISDNDKGIVTEAATDLTGTFVKITYNFGFADTTGTYQAVPDWLAEACKLLALCTMISSPNPTLEQKDLKDQSKALVTQFEAIMGQNVRYAPGALLPI